MHCTPLPLHPPVMNTQAMHAAGPTTINDSQKCPWEEVPLVFVPVGTPLGNTTPITK